MMATTIPENLNNPMTYQFPIIMGILNVTPDSFSDGGKYFSEQQAINHALKLLEDGADIIDIGGESTRPGAEPVSTAVEIQRVAPIIKELKKQKPETIISIDTVKYDVASAALDAGATMINDISGLDSDPEIASLAAEMNVSLVLMHIQGVPRNMQKNPVYSNVVEEVFNSLKSKIDFASSKGVKSIYADVGIGFGKTFEHNIELLKNLHKFEDLDVPLLLGISRKSFIGKMLGIDTPEMRDIPSAIIHALLLKNKIGIIRVHNVSLLNQLRKINSLLSVS